MIPGSGNPDFIEFGECQHRVSGAVTSGRCTEDSDPRRVHIRIARGHLLDQGHMVFERSTQIAVRELVKSPRASNGASAIDHDNDEAQFCHRLQPRACGRNSWGQKIPAGPCRRTRRWDISSRDRNSKDARSTHKYRLYRRRLSRQTARRTSIRSSAVRSRLSSPARGLQSRLWSGAAQPAREVWTGIVVDEEGPSGEILTEWSAFSGESNCNPFPSKPMLYRCAW